jgi:predicted  nucleic acid-binding Zn-ribbon protein
MVINMEKEDLEKKISEMEKRMEELEKKIDGLSNYIDGVIDGIEYRFDNFLEVFYHESRPRRE